MHNLFRLNNFKLLNDILDKDFGVIHQHKDVKAEFSKKYKKCYKKIKL